MKNTLRAFALTVFALIAATACVTARMNALKTVSAGHTGCTPEQIIISNHTGHFDYNETWNATCNGKVYLCSGLGNGRSEDYSCAPAVR